MTEPIIFIICKNQEEGDHWCKQNNIDRWSKNVFIATQAGSFRHHGRKRQEGDRLIIVLWPDWSFLNSVAAALIPCGYNDYETDTGQIRSLREFLYEDKTEGA